jgi:hypothetical protein
MSVEKNSRDIFGQKEQWSFACKDSDVFKKELTSRIIYSTQRTCFTPTLTRRTTDHSIAVINFINLNIDYAPLIETSLWEIVTVRFPNCLVVFVGISDFETSIFKAPIETTRTREE